MTKPLDILFFSIEGVGHMNASIGIGQVLADAGHRVVFVISEQWEGKLVGYGFEEIIVPMNTRPKEVDPSSNSSDLFLKGGAVADTPPVETIMALWTNLMPHFIEEVKYIDPILEKIIEERKPDVMVLDQVLAIPSVLKSGIPWILSCSFQPLLTIDDERTPPGGAGFPIDSDKKEWKEMATTLADALKPMRDEYNNWIVSKGLPDLPKNKVGGHSDFMNIYGYPLELDYIDVRPLPPNWFRFDNLKRTEELKFDIPVELQDKTGKLIYFSMGTIGGGDLDLMKRLVAILAESEHRFIVSKGPHHNKYELADNMWGQQSVPQIQVLPVVDLVITHGGNNTITETFYFGKPMIVLPIFGDQHDNAQRVHEKGLGLKLYPYKCTKEELLGGIEKILNDKELNEKLKNISKRIQTENSIAKLPQIIEDQLRLYKR